MFQFKQAEKSYLFYRLGNEVNADNNKKVSDEVQDMQTYLKLMQDQKDNANILSVLGKGFNQ